MTSVTDRLPLEVLGLILVELPAKDLLRARLACRFWRDAVQQCPEFWRRAVLDVGIDALKNGEALSARTVKGSAVPGLSLGLQCPTYFDFRFPFSGVTPPANASAIAQAAIEKARPYSSLVVDLRITGTTSAELQALPWLPLQHEYPRLRRVSLFGLRGQMPSAGENSFPTVSELAFDSDALDIQQLFGSLNAFGAAFPNVRDVMIMWLPHQHLEAAGHFGSLRRKADPEAQQQALLLSTNSFNRLERLEFHAVSYSSLLTFLPIIRGAREASLVVVEDLSGLPDVALLHAAADQAVGVSVTSFHWAPASGECEHVGMLWLFTEDLFRLLRTVQFNGLPVVSRLLAQPMICALEIDLDLWPASEAGLGAVDMPALRSLCINVPFIYRPNPDDDEDDDAWPLLPEDCDPGPLRCPGLSVIAFRSGQLELYDDCRDIDMELEQWSLFVERSLLGLLQPLAMHLLHSVSLKVEDGRDDLPRWLGKVHNMQSVDSFEEWLEYCD